MTSARQRFQPWLPLAYVSGLVWLNAYLCRQIFFIEYTGQMHSMHGFWMAMARLAGNAWYRPAWWPYWFGGMPFEFTYAPGVPFLTAAVARIGGTSVAHALNIVSGFVFAIGPAALFLMAWQLTGRAGWSFAAAAVYSLSAASELVVPDAGFRLAHLVDARRMYLCFVWDEVPHQLALALASIAVGFFARAFVKGGRNFALAIVFAAGALLASAFGATDLGIMLACLLASFPGSNWRGNLAAVMGCGLLSYPVACPFLPPSLLAAIRADANLFPESAFTLASLASLAGVLCGALLLWWIARKWRNWPLRFFLLLAWIFTSIPVLLRWNLHFLPQPGRYKVEVELALPLLLVFGVAPWVDRLPRAAKVLLAAVALILAERTVIAQRHFAKAVMRPVQIADTIEYQTARWTEENLPGQRVMAPGSIAQWMNAFARVPQLSGGSYPTAPTTVGQIAVWGLLGAGNGSGELSTLWLKAFGVDAVIVSGPHSPEFWKPFQGKQQFDGILPVIWNQRDTRIYAVQRRNRSLAWVIPETAVVRAAPRDLADISQIRRYVAALDDPALPVADLSWNDANHALVRATLGAGQVISVQVTDSRGWRATAGGRPVAIHRDGLGQMVLTPACRGACEIEMVYDGGWESTICRILSLLALIAAAVIVVRLRRPAPVKSSIREPR